MTTPYKLNVRIGDAEFAAEGSEQQVRDQFEQFMAAVTNMGATGKPKPEPPRNSDDGGNNGQSEGASKDRVERVFSVDKDKQFVSLKILPRTDNREADSLLLILYGFKELVGLTEVNAVRLSSAARQSGLQLERIDRTINAHRQYVTEGGAKRGKRYGLNNQGINKAIEIIGEMV